MLPQGYNHLIGGLEISLYCLRTCETSFLLNYDLRKEKLEDKNRYSFFGNVIFFEQGSQKILSVKH